MLNKGFILVVSGPSGSGKSSVVKEFLKGDPSFDISISYTTRPMRHNEVNGRDYYFVSEDTFKEMIGKSEFVEWAKVHDNYYGTSKMELERITSSGKNVILEIDVKGAESVKNIFRDMVVTVFIIPESFKTLELRLASRATDSDDVIAKRLKNAKEEIEKITLYDYVIINKDGMIEEAVESLVAICKAERLRVNRVWQNYNNYFWR